MLVGSRNPLNQKNCNWSIRCSLVTKEIKNLWWTPSNQEKLFTMNAKLNLRRTDFRRKDKRRRLKKKKLEDKEGRPFLISSNPVTALAFIIIFVCKQVMINKSKIMDSD